MLKKKKIQLFVKGPVKKGALCLFLITIKAPQSLLTPKVLKSHQKDEKAVITGGSVSLRLGSLMQQGKNKNVQGRDGCEMGGGLGWQIMLHDHIFRARKVLLSQSHCVTTGTRAQSQLNYCTGCPDVCFPSRKHGGLNSPVQILILGEYPWRGSIGADMVQVLHTRKVSCVCTQSGLRTHTGKRRM